MLRSMGFALVLVGSAAHVSAQIGAPATAREDRGWIDVNFGVANAAEDLYTSSHSFVLFSEIASGAAAYSLQRGASFDVGGGYMFTPIMGIGVSLGGTAHEDSAGLAVRIPHPYFFNAFATDATTTNGRLARAEGAWHVQAMIVAVQTSRFRLRVFGGPSYFRVTQDTVSRINYDQVYQLFSVGNVVDITSYQTVQSTGTGWGGHAGADVSVFFNKVFGLGAVVRVSRGSARITDYGGLRDIKAGGVQFGGGLRLRF